MNIFNIKNEAEYNSLKYSVLFIAIAYTFSIMIRMIWVYQFKDAAAFYWNNELMINTNDGYYFASAVEYLLFGMHEHNPQIASALNSYPGLIYITAFLTKILPLSLETIILYLPAFISSLVVIPIILIARLFNMQILGLLSALLGSITWSYYNRTMVGYYDSDMFAVLLQMFVLFSFISLLVKHKLHYIISICLFISVYPFFYPQGLSLMYAMYSIYIVYALWTYRYDAITYVSIAAIAIALSPIGLLLKLVFVSLLLLAFYSKKMELKYWVGLAVIALVFFLFNANIFLLVQEKIFGYINRGTEENGLHFFQVIQTVREAGKIPFDVMANRISGSTIGVLAALIGYILLVMRHRQFIIALPLIGVGVFSLWGGLRFTIYAVPIAAMSAMFLIYFLTSYVKDVIPRYLLILIGAAALIYPNILHITEYKVPTVFHKEEVNALDKLKQIGSDKDYIVAWWDYGYPLWFYTNKNTLIDGGKHHHDNYIVSKILLSSSQKEAALLSRLAVETYVDSGYKNIADTLFKNHRKDQVNVDTFFDELHVDTLSIPPATRDVYLYLPFRMLDILPTVKIFSNINLDTGEKATNPFFYRTSKIVQDKDRVDFGSGVVFDQKTGILAVGNQTVPVDQIITAGYNQDKQLAVHRQALHPDASFTILMLKDYNTVLIMDKEMFNSSYIQMFFLENYDNQYFEPVILTPWAKVYRTKS